MIQTTISKGYYGWCAESLVELGDDRVLTIRTSKANGGIATRASVHRREGNAMVFVMFGDYSAIKNSKATRCTEKAVKELHAATLQDLDSIRAEVEAFYAEEVAA